MKRRTFLIGSTVAFASLPLVDSNSRKLNRDSWLELNRRFSLLSDRYELDFELVYCGENPHDFTGDTLDVAFGKVNRNFQKIADYMNGVA